MTEAKKTTSPAASPAASPTTPPIATPAEAAVELSPTSLLPPQDLVQLAAEEEDERHGDAESELDDSSSLTASITSNILKYRTIQGRRFHSEQGRAQYWLTNDMPQNEVMDIAHHMTTILFDGKLYEAPLDKDKVQSVVDIGTGTGIWAIDFADENPQARVVGTDISPIQPTWVPPNLEFQIDDCTQPWTFKPDSINYVHMRWLNGSIIDWYALFREAYRVTEPGGWLESIEPAGKLESDDGTVSPESALGQWGPMFVECGKRTGRSFETMDDNTQVKAIEAAGFVNIKIKDEKVPLGNWPKDERYKQVGEYARFALLSDLEGATLFATTTLGWSKDQSTVYAAHVRRELRSGKLHAYYRIRSVVGQKPIVDSN